MTVKKIAPRRGGGIHRGLSQDFSLFDATSWSKVRRAGQEAGTPQEQALNALAGAYYPPLLALGARIGIAPAEIEDCMQEVMAKALSPKVLGGLDPGRGRFSAYLSSALHLDWRQFIRRAQRQFRDRRQTVSLEDSAHALPATPADWQRLFREAVATGLMDPAELNAEVARLLRLAVRETAKL